MLYNIAWHIYGRYMRIDKYIVCCCVENCERAGKNLNANDRQLIENGMSNPNGFSLQLRIFCVSIFLVTK